MTKNYICLSFKAGSVSPQVPVLLSASPRPQTSPTLQNSLCRAESPRPTAAGRPADHPPADRYALLNVRQSQPANRVRTQRTQRTPGTGRVCAVWPEPRRTRARVGHGPAAVPEPARAVCLTPADRGGSRGEAAGRMSGASDRWGSPPGVARGGREWTRVVGGGGGNDGPFWCVKKHWK